MLIPPELMALSKRLSATFATREGLQIATEDFGKTLVQHYGDNSETARIFVLGLIVARLNRMEKRLRLYLALVTGLILAASHLH